MLQEAFLGLASCLPEDAPDLALMRLLTEYRALMGGLFKRMYSLDTGRLEQVFPRTVPVDLGLV